MCERYVKFKKPESISNQFSLGNRPNFISCSAKNYKEADSIDHINKRGGVGNRDITRYDFLQPDIKARFISDFEKLQAVSVAEAGEIVGSFKGKLGFSTTIRIPDPTDFEYINEYNRLKALFEYRFGLRNPPAVNLRSVAEIKILVANELRINPPFGRSQRTITKLTDDIANTTQLDTSSKLDAIMRQVKQGVVENRASQQAITAQLVICLADTNAIAALTQLQLTNLGTSLARVGVPADHKRLNLPPRFVDNAFYLANTGMINLLLISKVGEAPNTTPQYNYNIPVKNFLKHPLDGLPAIKLTTMTTGLANLRGYLDLERGGVINLTQLREFAKDDLAAGGGGFIGPNFSIDISLR